MFWLIFYKIWRSLANALKYNKETSLRKYKYYALQRKNKFSRLFKSKKLLSEGIASIIRQISNCAALLPIICQYYKKLQRPTVNLRRIQPPSNDLINRCAIMISSLHHWSYLYLNWKIVLLIDLISEFTYLESVSQLLLSLLLIILVILYFLSKIQF